MDKLASPAIGRASSGESIADPAGLLAQVAATALPADVAAMRDDEPILQGYLKKESSSSSWKRRWFVLKKDALLWRKSQDINGGTDVDGKFKEGSLTVSHIVGILAEPQSPAAGSDQPIQPPNCFQLMTSGGGHSKVLTVQAPLEAAKRHWLTAIAAAMVHHMRQQSQPSVANRQSGLVSGRRPSQTPASLQQQNFAQATWSAPSGVSASNLASSLPPARSSPPAAPAAPSSQALQSAQSSRSRSASTASQSRSHALPSPAVSKNAGGNEMPLDIAALAGLPLDMLMRNSTDDDAADYVGDGDLPSGSRENRSRATAPAGARGGAAAEQSGSSAAANGDGRKPRSNSRAHFRSSSRPQSREASRSRSGSQAHQSDDNQASTPAFPGISGGGSADGAAAGNIDAASTRGRHRSHSVGSRHGRSDANVAAVDDGPGSPLALAQTELIAKLAHEAVASLVLAAAGNMPGTAAGSSSGPSGIKGVPPSLFPAVDVDGVGDDHDADAQSDGFDQDGNQHCGHGRLHEHDNDSERGYEYPSSRSGSYSAIRAGSGAGAAPESRMGSRKSSAAAAAEPSRYASGAGSINAARSAAMPQNMPPLAPRRAGAGAASSIVEQQNQDVAHRTASDRRSAAAAVPSSTRKSSVASALSRGAAAGGASVASKATAASGRSANNAHSIGSIRSRIQSQQRALSQSSQLQLRSNAPPQMDDRVSHAYDNHDNSDHVDGDASSYGHSHDNDDAAAVRSYAGLDNDSIHTGGFSYSRPASGASSRLPSAVQSRRGSASLHASQLGSPQGHPSVGASIGASLSASAGQQQQRALVARGSRFRFEYAKAWTNALCAPHPAGPNALPVSIGGSVYASSSSAASSSAAANALSKQGKQPPPASVQWSPVLSEPLQVGIPIGNQASGASLASSSASASSSSAAGAAGGKIGAAFSNGLVLCALIERSLSHVRLEGVNHKARTRAVCVANIEKALQIFWKTGIKSSKIPPAEAIADGKDERIVSLLPELLETFALKPSRHHAFPALRWIYSVLRLYGDGPVPEALADVEAALQVKGAGASSSSPSSSGLHVSANANAAAAIANVRWKGLWSWLRDGFALCLIAHLYAGDAAQQQQRASAQSNSLVPVTLTTRVDLSQVYSSASTRAQKRSNVRLALSVLTELGCRLVVNEDLLIGTPVQPSLLNGNRDYAADEEDDDVALLQLQMLFETLSSRLSALHRHPEAFDDGTAFSSPQAAHDEARAGLLGPTDVCIASVPLQAPETPNIVIAAVQGAGEAVVGCCSASKAFPRHNGDAATQNQQQLRSVVVGFTFADGEGWPSLGGGGVDGEGGIGETFDADGAAVDAGNEEADAMGPDRHDRDDTMLQGQRRDGFDGGDDRELSATSAFINTVSSHASARSETGMRGQQPQQQASRHDESAAHSIATVAAATAGTQRPGSAPSLAAAPPPRSSPSVPGVIPPTGTVVNATDSASAAVPAGCGVVVGTSDTAPQPAQPASGLEIDEQLIPALSERDRLYKLAINRSIASGSKVDRDIVHRVSLQWANEKARAWAVSQQPSSASVAKSAKEPDVNSLKAKLDAAFGQYAPGSLQLPPVVVVQPPSPQATAAAAPAAPTAPGSPLHEDAASSSSTYQAVDGFTPSDEVYSYESPARRESRDANDDSAYLLDDSQMALTPSDSPAPVAAAETVPAVPVDVAATSAATNVRSGISAAAPAAVPMPLEVASAPAARAIAAQQQALPSASAANAARAPVPRGVIASPSSPASPPSRSNARAAAGSASVSAASMPLSPASPPLSPAFASPSAGSGSGIAAAQVASPESSMPHPAAAHAAMFAVTPSAGHHSSATRTATAAAHAPGAAARNSSSIPMPIGDPAVLAAREKAMMAREEKSSWERHRRAAIAAGIPDPRLPLRGGLFAISQRTQPLRLRHGHYQDADDAGTPSPRSHHSQRSPTMSKSQLSQQKAAAASAMMAQMIARAHIGEPTSSTPVTFGPGVERTSVEPAARTQVASAASAAPGTRASSRVNDSHDNEDDDDDVQVFDGSVRPAVSQLNPQPPAAGVPAASAVRAAAPAPEHGVQAPNLKAIAAPASSQPAVGSQAVKSAPTIPISNPVAAPAATSVPPAAAPAGSTSGHLPAALVHTRLFSLKGRAGIKLCAFKVSPVPGPMPWSPPSDFILQWGIPTSNSIAAANGAVSSVGILRQEGCLKLADAASIKLLTAAPPVPAAPSDPANGITGFSVRLAPTNLKAARDTGGMLTIDVMAPPTSASQPGSLAASASGAGTGGDAESSRVVAAFGHALMDLQARASAAAGNAGSNTAAAAGAARAPF